MPRVILLASFFFRSYNLIYAIKHGNQLTIMFKTSGEHRSCIGKKTCLKLKSYNNDLTAPRLKKGQSVIGDKLQL